MALSDNAKKIKKTWVAALRSGKYKQCEGTLYDPDGKSFCCLGVLQHKLLNGNVEVDGNGYTGKCDTEILSAPSLAFYKKFPGTGWIKNNQADLIEMNDHEGADFEQIANYIQANWR